MMDGSPGDCILLNTGSTTKRRAGVDIVLLSQLCTFFTDQKNNYKLEGVLYQQAQWEPYMSHLCYFICPQNEAPRDEPRTYVLVAVSVGKEQRKG